MREKTRYDIEKDARKVAFESTRLSKANTVSDIRIVEGRVAQYYWQAVQSIFPGLEQSAGAISFPTGKVGISGLCGSLSKNRKALLTIEGFSFGIEKL